ncbi:hypothetical protein B0H10DRAFT_2430762 [Mycena sp. CBHHK59/15]|nr:hypothetical protein B0H10DRAFT_2430762 [Mycena sp. CBHHK59/15]
MSIPGQTALILGATGQVGGHLLKELLASPHFTRVGNSCLVQAHAHSRLNLFSKQKMGAWLELLSITFTIFCALRPTNAGDLDVIPQESVVPQCSLLTVRWGQTPPLHLHVQPEALINVTNLVDLGVQDGTSTTFQVALPLGKSSQ